MYAWMWRHIPGNLVVKAILTALAVLALLWVLFEFVFPWAEESLPFLDVSVEEDGQSATIDG